jgi:CPA2 family monovalent cation:H+ antiporter-2
LNIFFSPTVAFCFNNCAAYLFLFPNCISNTIKIESHFLKNLNDREEKEIDRRYANNSWDLQKNLAGQTLRDIRIRELWV